jgi:hypothetical protein
LKNRQPQAPTLVVVLASSLVRIFLCGLCK